MSIELKVNGILIGKVYIKNEGHISGKSDLCNYYVKYSRARDERIIETYIEHKRGDGAEKLAEIVFKAVSELMELGKKSL